MHESRGWDFRRYVTLLAVVVLHIGLVAVLVMIPATKGLPTSTPRPVELLFLPPVNLPKIRSDNQRPHVSSGDAAISISPPVLDSSSPSSPASGSDGGSGIDWAAEARRALQAFELRNREHARTRSNPGPPVDDNWWPQAQHQPGERYKTAAGDWIVWLNSSCYQVVGATSPAYAPGKTLSQAVCRRESDEPSPAPAAQ